MIKRVIFAVIFGILLSLNLVFAINLDVASKAVSNSVIVDLDEPAVFNLVIRNLEQNDSFEIYSLVGVDITPEKPFKMNSGEKRTIRIEVIPQKSLMFARELPFTFQYKIRNSKNEIQEERLTINIIDLEDAFEVSAGNIYPGSDQMSVSIKNKVMLNFSEVNVKIDSAFFNYEKKISLEGLETKELRIPIEKEKTEALNAGNYLINIQMKTNGKSINKESIIKFLEQEGIDGSEIVEGFLIKRQEIIRKNLGNVKKTVRFGVERNFISYLFTNVNIEPTKSEWIGLSKHYTWEKELIPNEEIKVVIKTNWFYLIIIIILIIVVFVFIRNSIEKELVLRKNVSFVKTKGGQFALKVTLRAKSKRYLERIRIIDKLPPLVKLYDKFGAVTPDKIDLQNRRIEWNLEVLNKGEERIFTYIIYSRIGVVGRFELPSAKATYEKEGKVKEATSNRSFFINEPHGG